MGLQPNMNGRRLGRPPQQATRCSQATRGAVGNGLLEDKKRSAIMVGTINIMTLSGKVNELVDVMKERRIDILGVSETKWKD